MAYVHTAAALQRVREVIEDSAGTLRTTPPDRFDGDAPGGLGDEAILTRALVRPRVEARITTQRPSPASPPVGGNIRFYDVVFVVRVTRVVTPIEQLSDDDRDALFALCAEDVDVIAQALGYPGNLSATEGGTPTDIMSGVLVLQDSQTEPRGAINDGAQPVETTITFLGRLISRPAIST
ncbi:hypothetical protein [Sandaracinus amylolyticus]|uniref:Uncharacterized protein n=1 Tax=Sandaracinus amylolyticus TaxID=927083 RepID=A0A0F6W6P3_9BACT|nr:hypothetical protein [Sandaracinus amylolyticus]AKF08887.1 hypothetical protein DB32_006036 [Sandaracinus amylolyticus]